MTTFDKREEGFEKKFAMDEESRFKANARRNKLLGLWAAEKLGLSGDAANAYAKEVVMAYFGVQSRGEERRAQALAALRHIADGFRLDGGPGHHDLVEYRDASGYDNRIAIAYWRNPATFERWRTAPAIDGWWTSPDRLADGIGYFREIVAPRVDQFETLYSFRKSLPGVGTIMDGASIAHRPLIDGFEAVAKKHKIPHQLSILPRGGTDAAAIQRTRGGYPAMTLSIPTRYIHTVTESVHQRDLQSAIDLLAAWLET